MNIFVTDEDPVVSARELCDKHVRSKMQIESAIMLQNAFTNEQLSSSCCPRTKTGKVRKAGKGYSKHQCTLWVKESRANFVWLVHHALEMFDERDFRWPDSNPHFTKEFITWCKDNIDKTIHTTNKLTPFTVAIGKDSQCRSAIKDFNTLPVTEQYRQYIVHDKSFAAWTKRKSPSWYKKLD
jgi:ADP-heptose:LPS heptosyltransferase